MDFVTKNTPCGALKGLEKVTHLEFRGIRYATAGRFEKPVEVTAWNGTYDATQNGACSYQHRAFEEDAVVNPFYHIEFRKGLSFLYSEDCLFLNIWAPKQAQKCPVIFFIHGGSFTGGSCDEAHIDGSRFAENGVVFVAINYRLNAFGFCAHKDLESANFGLYDQTVAFEWVRKNIECFGGDPENITLMGQSAGAMSVDIHLTNPHLKGKFKRAVMLSGSGLQRCLLKPLRVEKLTPFWDTVAEKAGLESFLQLKKASPKALYEAWKAACKTKTFGMPYTFPVYDEDILSRDTFRLQSIPDIPYLIGCTCTDMIPMVLERLDKKWGRYTASHNRNGCWFYNFNRWLPGDDMGAWHSADLLYAFSSLDKNWRPFEPVDYRISQALSGALIAFAKNGDPNHEGIPEWKPGVKRPLSFAETIAPGKWHSGDNLKFTFSGKGKTI